MAEKSQTARSRVDPREQALEEETGKMQVGEESAQDLAKQLEKIHECLEDARSEAQSSASIAEQSLQELMDLTERLAEAEEFADSANAVATSFRLQCEILTRELEQRNSELQHWRTCAETLQQELTELQDSTKQKESSQALHRYEAEDLAAHIEIALRKSSVHKECEFQKLLNEVSTQNIKHLEKQLLFKDEKIARLGQDLERHLTRDQESQKNVIQLEFCFGEAQREIRHLKQIIEEQDRRNLCSHIWLQEAKSSARSDPGFWGNLKIPGLLSASAIAIACILKH